LSNLCACLFSSHHLYNYGVDRVTGTCSVPPGRDGRDASKKVSGNGAPRASPWSPKTIPTYAPGRRSASVRRRQGFGGSSAGERNPPKHGRSVAERVPIRSYTLFHGQGRGLLRRRMKYRPTPICPSNKFFGRRGLRRVIRPWQNPPKHQYFGT